MKKANFDMLKNLPVPEGWIENALAIPEQEEKKNAVVPFWKNRAVVAAASLVLVSALSLLLYLNFGVKPPVEVKSSAPATEIVWSTDENGETVATEIVIIPEGETRSDGNYQDGTQPTEPKSPIEQLIEQLFGTENTSPTTPTGGRGRTNPSTVTNPTTKPGVTESGEPLVYPTVPQADDPTYPPDMTEAPTPYETVPSVIDPTYAPDCTESVDDPDTPTQPPYVNPTTDPYEEYYVSTLTTDVSKRALPKNTTIYCKVYDENWVLCGDADIYSNQHIAQVTESGNRYTLSYTPGDYGILPKRGYYFYQFYDANGWKSIMSGDFVNAS